MNIFHRIAMGVTMAVTLSLVSASIASATLSLVWSDEFDGTTLDTANWTIDTGNGCPDLCGWGNNELQFYRPQNVEVTGGNLVLTAKAESFAGYQFTSGKIHSRDKQSFLYGRMEMRAKIPTGQGMWPAFWMMPQDDAYGGWAASGELDIMEASNGTTTIHGTLHFGGSWPNNTYSGGAYSSGGTNFGDDFHVYAVEWEEDQIRWYVDGVLYSAKSSTQWWSDNAPGNSRAPFDQPFYFILNAAVGGNFTGCTDPSCITASLPQQYIIDYVRVYQDTGNLMPVVEITAPTSGDNPPAGDVTIEATASDPDGTVALVEFYNGETLLGSDATAPYAFTWTGVADGCYDIVAKAIDDAGGSSTDTVDLTVGLGCGQTAYPGTPHVLPARLEAEDFDLGGEGVAYHDINGGNTGLQYRTSEDVDIESCFDTGDGFNVGWIEAGEWLEYTVDAPIAGVYPVDVRVASLSTGGTFRLEVGGQDVTGNVTVPVTSGWQTWATVTTDVQLSAGTQVLRFVAVTSGYNLNYLDVKATTTSAGTDVLPERFGLLPSYPNPFNPSTTVRFALPTAGTVNLTIHDVAGRVIRRLVQGEDYPSGEHGVVWNGRTDQGQRAPAGVYFSRLVSGSMSETRRMTMIK